MEIVDRSLRESMRRLLAVAGGGVSTRYSTRHVRIHQNPLMVSFVRMTGMSTPWGVVFGRALDAKPRIVVVADPRRPEALQTLASEFGAELLEYFGDANFSTHKLIGQTLKHEDMPQLWISDSANLGMLHSLNYAFFEKRAGNLPRELSSFARLCGFLFEHSVVVGHQLVVDATALLNNLYVLPADDYFASHLASTITWIKSGSGIDETRIKAIRSLDKLSSVTLDPTIENGLFHTLSSIPKEMPVPPGLGEHVKTVLEPELLRRWNLLQDAWHIANEDTRPENAEVKTLVTDSLLAFRHDYQENELEERGPGTAVSREPETDNEPILASLHYLRALEAEDKFVSYMVHDDVELLGDVFFDGVGFTGKVLSVSADTECVWKIELNEKFGRLLKKRESETYCLIGNPKNPSFAITGFTKEQPSEAASGTQLVWVVELTWSKENSTKWSFSTENAVNNSPNWVGKQVILVPSFAEKLHKDAQNVVKRSSTRPGAWALAGGSNE